MTTIAALPASPQAIADADLLVIDQVVSAVLTTYKAPASKLRTYLLNGASGLVVSNGTTLAAATIGTGVSLNAGNTLLNTGVLTFGAVAGAVVLGANLSMTGQTLEVSVPATGVTSFGAATGAVVLGANLSMTGQTLEVSGTGVASFGAATGAIVLGANLSMTGQTLEVSVPATGVTNFGTDTGSITISTGLQEITGSLSLKPATTLALGGMVAGSGTTIDAGGTLSVATGAGGVSSFGGATGSITVVAPLVESSGSLTLSIGNQLAISSSTLAVTATPTFTSEIVTGTISAGTLLQLVDSTSSGSIAAATNTALQLVGANNSSAGLELVNFGSPSASNQASIYFRGTAGTRATPLAAASGQRMGRFCAGSYDGTVWNNTAGSIAFQATEAWTGSARGTQITFTTTTTGSTSQTTYSFKDGNLTVPGNVVANSVTLAGAPAAGVVYSTGSSLAAATLSGASLSGGTLTVTGFTGATFLQAMAALSTGPEIGAF